MTQEEKDMLVSIIDDLRAMGDVKQLEKILQLFDTAAEGTLQRKLGNIERAEIFEEILESRIKNL